MSLDYKPHFATLVGQPALVSDPVAISPIATFAMVVAQNMSLNAHASPELIVSDTIKLTELLFNEFEQRGWIAQLTDPFNFP